MNSTVKVESVLHALKIPKVWRFQSHDVSVKKSLILGVKLDKKKKSGMCFASSKARVAQPFKSLDTEHRATYCVFALLGSSLVLF